VFHCIKIKDPERKIRSIESESTEARGISSASICIERILPLL
jgi:hypothetical protein